MRHQLQLQPRRSRSYSYSYSGAYAYSYACADYSYSDSDGGNYTENRRVEFHVERLQRPPTPAAEGAPGAEAEYKAE